MEVSRIDPEAAKERLDGDEGYRYVDVRSAEEFRAGHVPGAVNVPIMVRAGDLPGLHPNPEFLQQMEDRFPKDAKLIVGCQRGGRSLKAAALLIESGWTDVVDMRGGYDGEIDPTGQITFPGWARRGLPTVVEE